ncbi:hypothetical protein GCM10009678_38140 [Actinomadura kijaniata]|uniref:DUF4132 domain-containing protein n=1 Tax=Actinomadura namibiensis TaxID=182080 RepID=A0A7W3LVE6_ACTNM|nr:DUF4132 domain-containing protein [Actinomadura namibiensis]MBA8954937.1 hypothetical protein [Actinomadura namibiensis]
MSLTVPDEDSLILPAAWRSRLHPRRGGAPVPVPGVDAEAVREMRDHTERMSATLQVSLVQGHVDAAMAERMWAHLRGEPDPVGAAGIATLVGRALEDLPDDLHARVIDAWAAEHGLAFAARALVEMGSMQTDRGTWSEGARCKVFRLGPVREDDRMGRWWAARSAARRMRALLVAADEAEYRAALELLEGARDTPLRRIITSYLLPERADWLDGCLGELSDVVSERSCHWMLWCAVGSPEQAAGLGAHAGLGWYEWHLDIIATIAEGAGAGTAPAVRKALGSAHLPADAHKLLVNALSVLPDDEAFQVLADGVGDRYTGPALAKAVKRFPVRALRLLPAAAGGTGRKAELLSALLRDHVMTSTDLVAEVLAGLPDDAREAIEEITRSSARVPDAPSGGLPDLLVSPPWTRGRRPVRRTVLTGLTPPAGPELSWAEGEREEWARRPESFGWRESGVDWEERVAEMLAGTLSSYGAAAVLLDAPDHLLPPVLAEWGPEEVWYAEDWQRSVAARFGTDALPLILRVADARAATGSQGLAPFRSVEVARRMADWRARLKSVRPVALRWLVRHGTAAARLLVPDALGEPGPRRRDAEGALLALAAHSGAETVLAAAREYGDQAAAAIGGLLDTDPLERLPARVPKPGDWADATLLPRPLLRDRERALPLDATRHVVTMLAMSPLDEVYPGVDVVREVCDPASLAEFGWALFERWQAAGSPSKDGWALTQLGLTGDDETVRRLTPLIRTWPGDGGHKKAVAGLDVLAAIGTDVALMHLHAIAQKVRFKGLRASAREKIEEVADRLGLTADRLADRLVPDFGLDADGRLVLDYGPRRFTVGFDERLKPFVRDEDGRPRTALPKPGVKDDETLAGDAYQRFAALKKDVRTVAADQIHRLESAMVRRRRWTAAEFRDLFVAHPLLRHLVRRLVWLAEDGNGSVAFRVAEDGTFADVDDDPFTLPDTARVGIAHPLDLGEGAGAWSELLADYEIMQPFPQLGRPVHALTDAERASRTLDRFADVTVPTHRILGLERRGWERGEAQDAGVQGEIFRPLPDGRSLVAHLDPGISVGDPGFWPEQRLIHIALDADPGSRFGDLDPVTASEVLTDLTELTGP